MREYDEAVALIAEHLEGADFEAQPEERVVRAEEALGLRFPPSYRRFLSEYRSGGVGGEEIFGQGSYSALDTTQAGADGETPVVAFTPGRDQAGDALEVVAPDFGAFFLETMRADLQ